MRETILLFGFEESRQKKLMRALMPLRMRIRPVAVKDYLQPVGCLAGNKEIEVVSEEYKGDSLEEEMLLMAGLTSTRVDQLLSAIRKSGIGPIPYKAVLTATNQSWTAEELLRELIQEHAKMQGGNPAGGAAEVIEAAGPK